MPNFKYQAQDANGNKIKGKRTAADEQDLYAQLKEEGQYLLESQEIAEKTKRKIKLKSAALSDFCRQLGTLLKAGVSLARALTIIANEQGLNPKIREVYLELLYSVRQGTALSEAMEEQETFPPLLYHMFRSAEAAGSIDDTAIQMSEYYTKDHKLNSKVKNAMMYPAILATLMIVVVIFVISYIVPQFQDLFSEMEELPIATRILLGISNIVKTRWYILIIVIVLIVIGVGYLLQQESVRLKVDRRKVHMPVVGKLMRTIYTARFARTLSSLYSSGISMISALQIGRNTIHNTYIEQQFDDVIATIRRGEALSKGLGKVDGFEQKLAATVLVGEETGSLNTMLDTISEALDHDADMALTRMVGLIEPAMIVIMGLVIGFVIIAVIQPIYGSYSSIENSGTGY